MQVQSATLRALVSRGRMLICEGHIPYESEDEAPMLTLADPEHETVLCTKLFEDSKLPRSIFSRATLDQLIEMISEEI